MKTYTQLSLEERYFISSRRAIKTSFSQIARDLGRPTSTVTREFARNTRPSGFYAAFVADSYAVARRHRSRRGSHFSPEQWDRIRKLIEEDFSPEQIVSQLCKEDFKSISIQTIYRYVKKDRRKGGQLYTHLRIMPKTRRKRYGRPDSRGVLQGKRSISDRPSHINLRQELGHWEGDTVMGVDHHQCILTLLERKSGANRMAKLDNRTARKAASAIVSLITAEPHLFKTITFDNGTEFHSYKDIEAKTNVTCYFANPHHPWERGCNENFNGLLRQYFPKGKSLSYIGSKKLQCISDKLNSRPRKRLGFCSPKEVLNESS